MRIGILPDVQAKPGLNFKHLAHVGAYFAEKQPDYLVCLGDFNDMPSCGSHDQPGSLKAIGRRFDRDFAAGREAMDTLMDQIARANGWRPKLKMLLGNHEQRIERVVNDDPRLEGTLSYEKLGYEEYGWEVSPFLEVITIRDIAFSHYLTSGVMGRPITTASAILSKRHMSAVVGHQQGFMAANAVRADGTLQTAIIAGSCYKHKEDYMGPQGNNHFRGLVMLHDVREGGVFEHMAVSLDYLEKRYA